MFYSVKFFGGYSVDLVRCLCRWGCKGLFYRFFKGIEVIERVEL